jgi:hypothetical protein
MKLQGIGSKLQGTGSKVQGTGGKVQGARYRGSISAMLAGKAQPPLTGGIRAISSAS